VRAARPGRKRPRNSHTPSRAPLTRLTGEPCPPRVPPTDQLQVWGMNSPHSTLRPDSWPPPTTPRRRPQVTATRNHPPLVSGRSDAFSMFCTGAACRIGTESLANFGSAITKISMLPHPRRNLNCMDPASQRTQMPLWLLESVATCAAHLEPDGPPPLRTKDLLRASVAKRPSPDGKLAALKRPVTNPRTERFPPSFKS
jgi:hypothetical protein